MAPDDPYPAALDDATAVLSWLAGGAGALAGGAGALGIDPARIVLGGVSAGGGLAASRGADSAASRRARESRRMRRAVWPWGREAVVTRSSRSETSGDLTRQCRVKGSNFVSRT